MNKKSLSILSLLLALALLVVPAAVTAQDTTGDAGAADGQMDGSGPNSALSPLGEWRTIEPGAQHWYGFRYAGNDEPALIWMSASPANQIEFEVWTAAQLEQLGRGDSIDPLGRGTTNEFEQGDASWLGGSPESEAYYLVVRARETLQGTGGYALNAEGGGVRLFETAVVGMPTDQMTPAAQATPTAQMTPTAEMTPAAQMTPTPDATPPAGTPTPTGMPGGGPADAAVGFGAWTIIEPGQSHWYAFEYVGNEDPALVWLDSEPNNAVGFSVWTERQVELVEDDPLGRGTTNELERGDVSWLGSSPEASTYFIVVTITDNNHVGPASYMLMIEGSGARLIQPEISEAMQGQ